MAPTIVFDLDGTLVDTAPDLIDTLNVVLARQRLAPVSFESARSMIGAGARAMLEKGLAARNGPVPADEIDGMFNAFIDYYAAHIADRSRPFPGVEIALDHLIERGFVLAVCTNKLEWLSRKLLDAVGLSRYFSVICGQDTFGVMKPDPEVWRRTVLQTGGDPAVGVMVGDSATDILLARAARVPVVAVDFGYTDVPVSDLGPDRIISHFESLPGAVAELSPGAG